MLRNVLFFCLSLVTIGCGPRYVDYFPCHDDGTVKPAVAILPIKVTCDTHVKWDITRELSQAMDYSLKDHGQLYVLSKEEMGTGLLENKKIDFFNDDLFLAKQAKGADFIILQELIEHDTKSSSSESVTKLGRPLASFQQVLAIRMRVKILDIRSGTPCILLQEIFSSEFLVPTDAEESGFEGKDVGSIAFWRTPIGRAYQDFVASLVDRYELVIGGAY